MDLLEVFCLNVFLVFFWTKKPADTPDKPGLLEEDKTLQPDLESLAQSSPAEPVQTAPEPEDNRSIFWRGLSKSRQALSAGFGRIFGGSVDEDALEALEETLLSADVGVSVAMDLVQFIKEQSDSGTSEDEMRTALKIITKVCSDYKNL